ncbi:CDP-alcohol phosphatidyltransferase family protein [Tritrichomonas foetus]|uniref:CDP-diacylglycerol--inositol 3-phosphatidyltransferase n=1 Tax=Tritrichomonas foetus TaxID=1144522 RepID=A0A1J4L4K8_9EUKA|nr:CDP-alcohol phosphatidyltransferase family protein [Tritrichomonas foetus]|eukprot:OHT16869.1 CDP-alcohol phosphatidyltransferase family protein [Tritrichomonas foetus]
MVSRFLYIPNLIGYSRMILMFIAYYVHETHPLVFIICYALSQLLDMLDGRAARAFNQATKFGAMLDMVTDRCSTVGLMLTLSARYPQYTFWCHVFIWLDICSHWCHMLSSGKKSHKLILGGPWLLRYYYATNWFMVLLIIGAEGFPLCLYALSFKEMFPPESIPLIKLGMFSMLPLFILKHIINVIQFVHASILLDEPDEEKAK